MERIPQYCYTSKDFRVEWFSGTGPGGQNRNKVQACCRITHIPTGIKMTAQRARSRSANFRDAFQRLCIELKKWIEAEIRRTNPQRMVSDSVIRTYHFADNRVLDHASRHLIAASELEKKFGELIEARKRAIEAQSIAQMEE